MTDRDGDRANRGPAGDVSADDAARAGTAAAHEPTSDPVRLVTSEGYPPAEEASAPGPAHSMAGPMGPEETTELVGDPMADQADQRSEAGAATGATVGTGVGGPVGTAVGAIIGAVGGMVSPDADTAPGESDEPLADPPAGEGTGPIDPIMRSTMSH